MRVHDEAVAVATSGHSGKPRRRSVGRMAGAVGAVLVVLAAVMVPAPAFAAAPTRGDSKNETVVFVHGFNLGGRTNCTADWTPASYVLRNAGFTGPHVTFGYYGGDTACNKKFNGTVNTPLDTVAKALAQYIYTEYSRHNKPVDIVAHSMGGLIARRAISGTQRREAGFPAYLYVEDVVTLSTPHLGAHAATGCQVLSLVRQCTDMRPGSAFLSNLERYAANPQSRFGTDWSTIGSNLDEFVSVDSARGMDAGHKYTYINAPNTDHTGIRVHNSTARNFTVAWQHAGRAPGTTRYAAESALYITANALYRWSTW